MTGTETSLSRFADFARTRLEAALSALVDDDSDTVLADLQLALMAAHMHYGSTGPIVLLPADVIEYIDRNSPECICPDGLPARGGFRSGCPVHHAGGES